jgi:hypothetical protein
MLLAARQPGTDGGARAGPAPQDGIVMSWPDGTSQPQQASLVQALHDFGDATDQAVRAWAGQLTMRQAFDITYVLADILRRLGTTAERLSRYRPGNQPAQDHDAGPGQPNEEIAQARASISSARAALVHPFQEAYRASGGWPEPGGDPARDGTAVFLAHLLYQRLRIADEPWPELSGTDESRDYLVQALIGATDGLAWDIQNLARDAPEPMQAALTEAVAHLDDTFAHLRESLICSARRNIAPADAEELDRNMRLAVPLPGRAQALRAKNTRRAPHPARTAAADFPCPVAGSDTIRSPALAPAASPGAAPWHRSRRSRPKDNHGHHQ